MAGSRQSRRAGGVGRRRAARRPNSPVSARGAHWAILSGGAVEMRRAAYDPVAACAQVSESSSYPDVTEGTGYFPHVRATDVNTLAVMAPRDGRA